MVRYIIRKPDGFNLRILLTVALGSICAAFLNAANNAINQIYDLEIDRVNKPDRPLVTKVLSLVQAWKFVWLFKYFGCASNLAGGCISIRYIGRKTFAPLKYHQTFFIYVIALLSTFIYSVPAMEERSARNVGKYYNCNSARMLLK